MDSVESEIESRNRAIYDTADDARWRLSLYEPWHGGWGFSSIGGRRILDFVGAHACLAEGSRALELGSGLGDGCRYLASRFGCRVTGIETNPLQVARARGRLKLGGDGPRRVRIIEADASSWRSRVRFDAAYALDFLMLVPGRSGMLANARSHLRPGGSLVIADVLAGPGFTRRARDFVWRSDGILELPTMERQVEMLRELEFEDVEALELTHLAVACNACIVEETSRHRAALEQAVGGEAVETWQSDAESYRRLFEEGALAYARIAGRLPAAGRGSKAGEASRSVFRHDDGS